MRKYFALTYIARGVQVGSQFLIMILINRFSEGGVYTYGQLTLIISSAGMISSLLTMRTGEAVTKFLVEADEKQQPNHKKTILYTGFISDLVIALFVVSVVYFAEGIIGSKLLKTSDYKIAIIMYGMVSAVDILKGVPTSYFQTQRKFAWINGIVIVRSVINLLLVGCMFLLGFRDLTSIVLSALLASVLTLIIDYLYFVFNTRNILFNKSKVDRALVVNIFKFNLIAFLSTSIKAGNRHIGQLIIGYFLTPLSVGLYQTLKRLTFPVLFIATPLQLLYYPKIVKWVMVSSTRLKRNIIRSVKHLTAYGILYGIFLLMAYSPILLLTGVEVEPNYQFYTVLILSTVILQNNLWWTRSYANALNPMLSVYSNSIATVFQLIIVSLSTKFFLIEGFLISQISLSVILTIFWFKRIHVR